MAGLLTHPVVDAFPPRKKPDSGVKFQQQNCLEQLGFTAAGTAPDLHRIPYYAVSPEEKQTPIENKGIQFG